MNKLNPNYSTTRLVTREMPIIEESPDAAFKTVLFLPEDDRGGRGKRRPAYSRVSEKRTLKRLTVNPVLSRLL